MQLLMCSGIPEAEIFGRKRKFSLFGFRFRPPKFYSKYSAFSFVLKMGHYSLFLTRNRPVTQLWCPRPKSNMGDFSIPTDA